MKEISKKTFWQILIFLVLLRVVMVLFLMQDIPHTEVKMGGWWFRHGGDEVTYFNFAKSIAQLDLKKASSNIGFPLFLAPFIYFTRANTVQNILKPIFIINAFILFSLSIILVAFIAKKLFKSKTIAAICAALFCLHPYIFYILFHKVDVPLEGTELTKGVRSFIYLNWLQVISDSLSAFLVFLCFFLFFLEFKRQKPRGNYLILLGILAGFSALVRIGNALIVPIFILGWLLKKRIKEAFLVGMFSLFSFLPQLIYNFSFFGSPLKFGYEVYSGQTVSSFFSFNRFVLIFQKANFYIPGFIFLFLGVIIFFILGIKFLWQKDKISSLILTLWFFAYLIFYIYFGKGGVQLRFFIPAIPPFIFIGISSLLFIYQWLKSKYNFLPF